MIENAYGVTPPPTTSDVRPLRKGCRTEIIQQALESNMFAVGICGRVAGSTEFGVCSIAILQNM